MAQLTTPLSFWLIIIHNMIWKKKYFIICSKKKSNLIWDRIKTSVFAVNYTCFTLLQFLTCTIENIFCSCNIPQTKTSLFVCTSHIWYGRVFILLNTSIENIVSYRCKFIVGDQVICITGIITGISNPSSSHTFSVLSVV